MSRRAEIQKMLESEPEDLFLQYALAMEWESEGELEKSSKIHRELMSRTPPHVPSYFRVAQQLVRAGEADASREVLREGIEIARQQGDHHAAAEMSELLQSIGDLDEL